MAFERGSFEVQAGSTVGIAPGNQFRFKSLHVELCPNGQIRISAHLITGGIAPAFDLLLDAGDTARLSALLDLAWMQALVPEINTPRPADIPGAL